MLIKDLLINTVNEKAKKGTIPYIEIGDIDITTKKYSLKNKESVQGAKYAYKNAILISTVRPTRGAITIVEEEKVAVSSAFAILNINEKMCNYKYLFYYLNKVDFYEYLGSNSKGATYPTCSKDDIYNYKIELPCLEKQNMVVQIFDNINKSISIRNVQLKKCENLIKSQFVEMFGDPIINDMKWKSNILGNIGTFKNGINFGKTNNGIEVPFLGVGNFKNGKIISKKEQLDRIILNEKINEEYLLKNGDIVFVRSNGSKELVGRTTLIRNINFNLTYSGFCIRFRNKDKNVNPIYLIELFNNDRYFKQLKKDNRGANINNINQQMLTNLNIIIPPIKLQNRFATIVKQIDKQKFEFEKSLKKLEEMQSALMQEYFG